MPKIIKDYNEAQMELIEIKYAVFIGDFAIR